MKCGQVLVIMVSGALVPWYNQADITKDALIA
jgi:hypothetical protein